jgi:DNA-directed RNA polymerase specialized sigma24 family protein
MPSSTKITRTGRKIVAKRMPGVNKSPKIDHLVKGFFKQMEAPLVRKNRRQIGHDKNANERSLDPDLVEKMACRAEEAVGHQPEKLGWLAWFKRIIHQEKGLLRQFQKVATQWPPVERELFELYFVRGMELDPIAVTFHEPLVSMQRRLREEVIKQALYESKNNI